MITRNTSYGHPAPAGGPPPSHSGVRDVLRIFYRHKKKMVAVFCGTLVLFVAGLIAFPRSYTSEARLFLRLGKESVSLDPTATTNEVVTMSDSRESEINSELELLRSRILYEDVVQQLGADDILSDAAPKGVEPSWMDSLPPVMDMAHTWLYGDISAEEKAVSKLAKMVSVSSPPKSSVFVLQSKARNPKQAQRILQAYLGAYQVRHGKANRISGSYDFFDNQSALLEQQLTLASNELRDAKNENNVASVEGQRANVEAQANTIEVAILENQRALISAEAQIAALKKTLTELPEQQLAEELVLPNAAADTMRNELYKVQIAEKEASSRYTALHPTVIALRRQVAETRDILSAEESRRSHSTKKLSPVHQSVQTELATTQALAAARKAESESLKKQFEAVQTKIRELNDNELRITDLSRKSELLESSYREYHKNRELARIDSALEMGRISNVNITQPATFVAKPTSPVFTLGLALAFLVSVGFAVLAALAAEFLDRSLRSSDQIERELGIPVLFTVPRGTRHELAQN
jgi:uncharacterized protein involved in exopolysaccharide biosynthesis